MSTGQRHPHVVGRGPGDMTADGCPVELWAALPAGGIPTLLGSALPAHATILDLGAGAGRLADPLVAAGYSVIAVDESTEMLSRVRKAATVCSTIEELRLDRKFDAVLLASHLVNVPDDAQRHRLLATCQHHVAADGIVIIQRFTTVWAAEAGGRTDLGAGITSELVLEPTSSDGRTLVSATAAYTLGDRRWEQSYVTYPLDDDALSGDLEQAGLRLDRWLSDDGSWVAARPVGCTRRES